MEQSPKAAKDSKSCPPNVAFASFIVKDNMVAPGLTAHGQPFECFVRGVPVYTLPFHNELKENSIIIEEGHRRRSHSSSQPQHHPKTV